MSQLRIVDLNFCERALPNNTEVKGGLNIGFGFSVPGGSVASRTSSDHSSGYSTGYYFDRSTGSVSYYVGYGYSNATAGAVSGSASDGYNYASAYARSIA